MVRQISADDHAAPNCFEVKRLRVGLDHFDAEGKLATQDRNQLAIALDGDHVRAGRREDAGEVAEARSQLDDPVAGPRAREPRQVREHARVAEKVLPPFLFRPKPVPAQKLAGRAHSAFPSRQSSA